MARRPFRTGLRKPEPLAPRR